MKNIKVLKLGGTFFVLEGFLCMRNYFKFEINNGTQTLFVVSAVKGITRLLWAIVAVKTAKLEKDLEELIIQKTLNEFYDIHDKLISSLFPMGSRLENTRGDFILILERLKKCIDLYKKEDNKEAAEAAFYASVLKFGEQASSTILHHYLNSIGISAVLFDARKCIVTDSNYREAKIIEMKHEFIDQILDLPYEAFVTQGFIGRNEQWEDTVLGFDSSDSSAIYFAVELGVDPILWKDTKLFKEDPRKKTNLQPVKEMSNSEFQKLETSPIRKDGVNYAVENGRKVIMKCFLDPDYEAIIY